MCDFRRNDVVVCIADRVRPGDSPLPIKEGQTYRVTRVWGPADGLNGYGVDLDGVPRLGAHPGQVFSHKYFRRIYRPNGSFIDKLMEPVDLGTEAHV